MTDNNLPTITLFRIAADYRCKVTEIGLAIGRLETIDGLHPIARAVIIKLLQALDQYLTRKRIDNAVATAVERYEQATEPNPLPTYRDRPIRVEPSSVPGLDTISISVNDTNLSLDSRELVSQSQPTSKQQQ